MQFLIRQGRTGKGDRPKVLNGRDRRRVYGQKGPEALRPRASKEEVHNILVVTTKAAKTVIVCSAGSQANIGV